MRFLPNYCELNNMMSVKSSENVHKETIARTFSRAARTYDDAAVLHAEVGQRLCERLDLIRLQPEVILDIGAATGRFSRLLAKRYKHASVVSLDIAEGMLLEAKRQSRWFSRQRFVCGDAEALSLKDNSVDFIFSCLALQWCPDLEQVFREFFRVLKPGGLLLFATFGPDTLKELRASWAEVDLYAHVNTFVDMHDIGDMLLRSTFSDPVMDMEYFTLMYPNVLTLMHELKALGAQTLRGARRATLMGRQRLTRLAQTYETYRKDGRLPATYEVIYGHAWKPTDPQIKVSGTETRIPLEAIKRVKK
jgi:malonyl-CoA O-methyltransferase